MTKQEANKQVVTRYVEAFNAADYERLRELVAPDAIIWGVLGHGRIDNVIPIWRELHAGVGIQLQVEQMIAEGDDVAVRFIERGKFIGPFRGHAPTGKTYEIVALEWFTVHDGRIQQRWGARDSATVARQIGMPLS